MCLSRTVGHTLRDEFPPAECHWERSERMFLLHLLEGWSISNDLILCSAPLTLTNWYCTGHNVIRWLKHKSTQLPTFFHNKSLKELLQPAQDWQSCGCGGNTCPDSTKLLFSAGTPILAGTRNELCSSPERSHPPLGLLQHFQPCQEHKPRGELPASYAQPSDPKFNKVTWFNHKDMMHSTLQLVLPLKIANVELSSLCQMY